MIQLSQRALKGARLLVAPGSTFLLCPLHRCSYSHETAITQVTTFSSHLPLLPLPLPLPHHISLVPFEHQSQLQGSSGHQQMEDQNFSKYAKTYGQMRCLFAALLRSGICCK